jgi:hypothetical protein
MAAIAGGKGRFLDAIPVEQWHSPEFCEQAYRTGVPNVDAYIYYYGGENTWRNVLDACGKEYRLPAVVPNDAEQLPRGDKRTADAAPDGKAPVQGIRRLGAVREILGEIVAMTGDPLPDRLINEEVLLGSRGRRERARVALALRDTEAAKLIRQIKVFPLLRIPADKQTYRMVMTALDFDGEALYLAAPKFQADPAICLKAAKKFRGAVEHVKAEKLSPENYLKVCLAAAASRPTKMSRSGLRGVDADRIGSKNYLKVCLAAVNSVELWSLARDERHHVQWDKLDPADKLELNIALARRGI